LASLGEAGLLFGAGLAMGAINNLAGGGGALALIAFEAGAGMSPISANASMRPAALAISVGGSLGLRSTTFAPPAEIRRLAWWTVPGALLGSVLVVRLPLLAYRLVLAGVLAIVLWQQLRRSGRAGALVAPGALRGRATWLWFLVAGIHMGFVQVGAGLVFMAILGGLGLRNLVQVNSAKMILVFASAAASVAALALAEAMRWDAALLLALGAGLGSFAAGRWSLWLGHGAVRLAAILISAVVLARVLWQIFAATGG
jgi:uncharacterized membrane protein YfcA